MSSFPLPILAVDDEEMILNLLVSIAEDFHIPILTAGSSKQAQNLFLQHRFGLILTDILMPELNGIKLCHWIRNRDANIPIIAMSGNLRPSDSCRLEKMKVRIFSKPLRFTALESLFGEFYTIP